MKPEKINQFFVALDRELHLPAEVIIIGASAESLMGHVRPSLDIDFEIRAKSGHSGLFRKNVVRAIETAQEKVKIAVNYSENIKGWSMINYLDYRKTAIPYKKIGLLDVKIMAPEYWTIGKMTRFLELDIQDMLKIIKAKNIAPERLRKIWIKAFASSDLSLELGQFKQHVIFFVERHGTGMWGRSFNAEKWIQEFTAKLDR